MKPIGGFFELEVGLRDQHWHPHGHRLTSGRACLAVILRELRPERVWAPFYVCDSALAPMREADVPVTFYALDDRLEAQLPEALAPQDALLVVNHFGLGAAGIDRLAARHGERLIVDDTQAFFEPARPGVWTFNSARKFFGVPDGAYLHAPRPIPLEAAPNEAIGYDHLIQRWLGHQQAAYQAYAANEALVSTAVRGMSRLAEGILANVDYPAVAARRRANFQRLATAFGSRNALSPSLPDGAVPFCYPLLLKPGPARPMLYDRGLFVPTLWPECVTREGDGFAFERALARDLLPLPIDHRYGPADMDRLVATLEDLIDA